MVLDGLSSLEKVLYRILFSSLVFSVVLGFIAIQYLLSIKITDFPNTGKISVAQLPVVPVCFKCVSALVPLSEVWWCFSHLNKMEVKRQTRKQPA